MRVSAPLKPTAPHTRVYEGTHLPAPSSVSSAGREGSTRQDGGKRQKAHLRDARRQTRQRARLARSLRGIPYSSAAARAAVQHHTSVPPLHRSVLNICPRGQACDYRGSFFNRAPPDVATTAALAPPLYPDPFSEHHNHRINPALLLHLGHDHTRIS